MGLLKYFLGIEIVDVQNGLCMSQRKYCIELLHGFGMLGCKPLATPMEFGVVCNADGVNSNDLFLKNVNEFHKLVGKLIYLTITRPDISFLVHVLSQFMHKPHKSHLDLAMRVLRYLKGSPGKGILISKCSQYTLTGYVDADRGKCLNSRKSVTGYCIFLGGSLVSWRSKKQNTVSRSTTESEYRALGVVTCEIVWIVKLLNELRFRSVIPVNVFCDNSSTIKLALNPVFHERTEHLEIDLHFVREKIEVGLIKVLKIGTDEQKLVEVEGLGCKIVVMCWSKVED